MPVTLPLFEDLPAHRYRITLEGVELVLVLTYRDRSASWYLDAYTVDDEPIVLGRRLAEGWLPWLGHGADHLPPGGLYVRPGPVLTYYSSDELSPIISGDGSRAEVA